ncbi:MAG: hypothetical protein N3C12_02565 [Candidatus Binatia bacterium]|nr:hypothetical protein [Candidatus Binatia bacterium]
MAWTSWLWTAVIPTLPLVVPMLNWVLWGSGIALVLSAAALALEWDRSATDVENAAALDDGAVGCAA